MHRSVRRVCRNHRGGIDVTAATLFVEIALVLATVIALFVVAANTVCRIVLERRYNLLVFYQF